MSFYECLGVFPEGASSASRMALTAKGLGYQGIIICNRDPGRIFMLQAAEKIKGIEVVMGAEVTSSSCKALKSRISALRARYPFIMVRAGSEEIVRVASEDPNVDLLIHPCDFRRPLTIASARAAKLNQICLGFDLSGLVRLRGSSRSRWLGALRRNLQLVRKFEIHPIITASATSHLDLHSPRDLVAMAEVAGFERDEAKEALRRPGMLLELNRRKWVGPGVELL
ncbi:MAG: RNase P subunit p30 family protein [Methanothrix sp.]|nr:RNase P subunit p30 family protein [Methanothrix sp.]